MLQDMVHCPPLFFEALVSGSPSKLITPKGVLRNNFQRNKPARKFSPLCHGSFPKEHNKSNYKSAHQLWSVSPDVAMSKTTFLCTNMTPCSISPQRSLLDRCLHHFPFHGVDFPWRWQHKEVLLPCGHWQGYRFEKNLLSHWGLQYFPTYVEGNFSNCWLIFRQLHPVALTTEIRSART